MAVVKNTFSISLRSQLAGVGRAKLTRGSLTHQHWRLRQAPPPRKAPGQGLTITF